MRSRGLTPGSRWCRPSRGLRSLSWRYPALTRWAILCRRYAAGLVVCVRRLCSIVGLCSIVYELSIYVRF